MGSNAQSICRCSSLLFIFLSSTIFFILGLVVLAGSIAIAVTVVKELFPTVLWGGGIGAGVVILLFALTGYLGMCRKEKKKWLIFFLIFNLIVFFLTLAICISLFFAESAIKDASDANFVNLTTFEKTAANPLKDGVKNVWDGCDAEVLPVVNETDMYVFSCSKSGFSVLENLVNDNCLDDPFSVPFPHNSSYVECYGSEWWKPEFPYSNATATINTAKGTLCACEDTWVDFILKYLLPGKYVSIGVTLFFFFTFLGCSYLCCFGQKHIENPDSQLKGYIARP